LETFGQSHWPGPETGPQRWVSSKTVVGTLSVVAVVS